MIIIDIILLIALFGFVFYGLFFGLIRTIGALAGVVVGAWLASRFYLIFFSLINEVFFGYDNLGKVLSFIILFVLINRLVGFLFSLLDKTFHIIAIIPFLKTINRLGGAVLGLITGALVIGLFLYVASRYVIIGSLVGKMLVGSKIAPFLMSFVKLLTPLLPEILKKLNPII